MKKDTIKKHIHIPYLCDFYLMISKTDPDKRAVQVQEAIKVSEKSFDKGDLKENLDRVNMWIGNCDQKASIVLALIGVAMTVLCTSDFAYYVRHTLIIPIKKGWPNICAAWDGWQLAMAILLISVIVLSICSLYQLLFSLRAKTDYDKFKQDGMTQNSMYHYECVAKRKYSEFCKEDVEIMNDLRSQVYINSCICTSKFEHYKKGIKLLEYAIPICLMLGLIIFIY